jgi:DnaK suppressor protein
MTSKELGRYREMLLNKQAELMAGLTSRDDIAIERSADQADEIQGALDRELIIRTLDSKAITLRSVAAATQRIADGTFGVCVSCDEDIGPKRLNAVPWTAYCVACQEAADREERGQIFPGFKAA